ncbi:MAG: hypothetical protein J6A04_07260 [Clostridia bacterium]|nr:hypothetical protein [Clostridia bacterium]
MRSMASYLLLIFMVMFWIFRLVVAFTASIGVDIGFVPMNMNMEIILLFVTMVGIAFVGKRMLIGAIIYLVSYGLYFGVDLYNIVMGIIGGTTTITDYSNALASFIGVVLPLAVFFNLLIDKNRTNHPVDKKTDWFYKNDEYDRKIDERADQNQYRNY